MNDVFITSTPADFEAQLARRLRTVRKNLRWTQAELAERSALSVATIARLETTGQGQLRSLIQVLLALGRSQDLEALLAEAPPKTLSELRQREGHTR